MAAYLPLQITLPPSRPSSISELIERTTHDLWDPSKSLKYWLKAADSFRKAGRAYHEAGDLEAAFVEFTKAASLILEKLPTHKEYLTLLNPTQRSNLGLNGQDIIVHLAEIEPILAERYEEWERGVADGYKSPGRQAQSSRLHSAIGNALIRPKNPTSWKVNEVQEGTVLAQQLKSEAEDESLTKRSTGGKPGTASDSMRSGSPRDLTGHVVKSSAHPFASGGFGDIYKGQLNVRGRQIDVAIKTTRVYLQHDQHLERKMRQFRREIAVWSKLEHTNVLPLLGTIFDPSIHPDIPAMVCPWIKNGALSTYLESVSLNAEKRFILVNDVAHGLQYLHSQHVVHGDLSGSNVLVASDERACIADFGLSTLLTQLSGSTFATTRQAKGTIRWMAPELLDLDNSQETPTMQTDVYSFGSIMLQILTGSVPYSHLTRNEQVILAVARGRRPKRPDGKVVADHWWSFMELCWSPADGAESRPSGDEIVLFTGQELAAINAEAT